MKFYIQRCYFLERIGIKIKQTEMETHYTELLEEFLINEGYQYFGNNEKSNFTLDIQGTNGSWKNHLAIDNYDGQFTVRCICPIRVYPDKIHSMTIK